MAVRLSPPDPADLHPIAGVELGFAAAGIRKAARPDLMLMRFAAGTQVAGVFTQNSFAAAPVQVCRSHLAAQAAIRGLVVNAGNANCGTGARGLQAAHDTCAAAAALIGCDAQQILPLSTGVILEHLPIDRLVAALPRCVSGLAEAHWAEAAEAIMTTDTVAKGASRSLDLNGTTVRVTGIAKGVGMLQPNMATMLAFIATDAAVSAPALQLMVSRVANRTFNRVTVDGDTSTNDSFVLIATGCATQAAGCPPVESEDDPAWQALYAAVTEVATVLAQSLAREGEGATKFITVEVASARDEAEALKVARSIANSPLVKTALFASDPNLGRLIMAIGNAGVVGLDTRGVDLYLGAVHVIEHGERSARYREEDGAAAVASDEISIRVLLGRGAGQCTVWTCDFSYDYVKINAEYRT